LASDDAAKLVSQKLGEYHKEFDEPGWNNVKSVQKYLQLFTGGKRCRCWRCAKWVWGVDNQCDYNGRAEYHDEHSQDFVREELAKELIRTDELVAMFQGTLSGADAAKHTKVPSNSSKTQPQGIEGVIERVGKNCQNMVYSELALWRLQLESESATGPKHEKIKQIIKDLEAIQGIDTVDSPKATSHVTKSNGRAEHIEFHTHVHFHEAAEGNQRDKTEARTSGGRESQPGEGQVLAQELAKVIQDVLGGTDAAKHTKVPSNSAKTYTRSETDFVYNSDSSRGETKAAAKK